MLSRQIASKLRGYETPFYLYDMALLRQTLESVVYESKKYGYKVHYAIKTICWRSSANTGWASTAPRATSCARPSRPDSTPRASSMRAWANATRS